MALEKDDGAGDNQPADKTAIAETTPDKPERAERDTGSGDSKERRDLRSTIKAAFKEHEEPREPKKPREQKPADVGAAEKQAASGEKEIPKKDDGKPAADAAPQAPAAEAAPAALSKEIKAQWDKLDPAVRNEFLRREADTAKGVEQLKAKYKPLDDAFAPYQSTLQQYGKTPHEAVSQLFGWHAALSGPNKVQAFAALAKAHNFDLATLAPRQAPQSGTQAQPNQDADAILRPFIDPLRQDVTALKSELQRRDSERVQNDISSFAKDKPHFERVRVLMGHLMNSGQIQAATPKEAFDEAYARACRADPETFAAIQQEEQAKREAEAQAAQEAAAKKAADAEEARKRKEAEEVARARKASVGVRGSSPSGMATANANKGKSVRESLRAAMEEVGGAI